MTDKSKLDEFIDELAAPAVASEHPLFTPKELEAIKTEARAEVMADKKKAAKASMLDAEKIRLQREEGLTTGNSHMDEMMTVTIDLAPFSDRILVNQQPYWHGKTYTVARHIAESLRETMFRTWAHQNEIDGKGLREFYAKQHVQDLFKVTTPAKATFSARGM